MSDLDLERLRGAVLASAFVTKDGDPMHGTLASFELAVRRAALEEAARVIDANLKVWLKFSEGDPYPDSALRTAITNSLTQMAMDIRGLSLHESGEEGKL